MRKIILPVLILLLLLGSGCAESGAETPDTASASTSAVTALPVPSPEAQTLTIARMENNRFVSEAIAAFNAQSPGLQAESQWYFDQEGELKLALVAGDGPDLMSLEFFDYEIYAEKGVFTDLYPLLDADPDLSRSDLIEPVLTAMESSGGALYQIAPSFHLSCMFTCPETVDPDAPWNLSTVETFMEEHPDAGFSPDVKEPVGLLELLLLGYLPQLLDYETMTCDFTSGLFVRLLEDSAAWAARPQTYGDADAGAYSGGALLGAWCYLRDFSTYQTMLDDGLSTPSGFPSDSGGEIYAGSVTRFSICSGTGREALAWEFIKTSLSPEVQAQAPWLPLLKSEMESRAQKAQQETPPTVTQQYIDPKAAAQGVNSATVQVTLPPEPGMDTDAVMQMLALIDRASGCRGNSDANVLSIIFEESQSYFLDQKPPEDVAKIVQNRVELYLSEHT